MTLRALAIFATLVSAAMADSGGQVDPGPDSAAPPLVRVSFGSVEAPPLSMREGGDLRGYLEHYLAAVEQRSHLRFDVRFFDSRAALKQALNAGVVDVAGPIMQTREPVVRALFTRPLERLPIVIVRGSTASSNAGAAAGLADRRIGVVEAGVIGELLNSHERVHYVRFRNDVDALSALSNGQVDFVAMEENRALHYIEKLGMSQVLRPERLPIQVEPALAVRADLPALYSDLARAMQGLSDDERAAIRDSWLAAAPPAWYGDADALRAFGALALLLGGSFVALRLGTAGRAREARLVRSERLHRALSTSISDMVTLHGAGGAILYASPSTRGLTGYDPALLEGTYFSELLHPDDRSALIRVAMAVGRGREERMTLRLRCRSGEYRFFECIGRQFDAGKRGEFVVVSRDVTEHTRMVDELRDAEERFRNLAFHDARTGLPNRTGMMVRIQEAISDGGGLLSLLYVDIDNLKTINNVHGYAVGDDLIDAVAARLAVTAEGRCELARLGGGEFAAILRHEEPREPEMLAAVMMRACAQPIDLRGSNLYLTVSVGIARHPTDGANGEELLTAAGIALHAAKSAGRNLWRYVDSESRRRATHRAISLQNLRSAFERNEFVLHYQPKVALVGGNAVVGYEALLRWNSRAGMTGAGELIAVAEQSGFVVTLGEWVAREAARQSLEWRRDGLRCPIAVNVSALQLHDERLVAALRELTARDPELPELLVLELTETAIATEVEQAKRVLDEIGALGFEMHIDDFGTGYSSLAQLSRLPVRALKIDRSLVAGIPADTEASEIVKAILALARALRLEVIAEGVETPAQEQFLRGCGCRQAQGFHYGAAMVPQAALALWQEGCGGSRRAMA